MAAGKKHVSKTVGKKPQKAVKIGLSENKVETGGEQITRSKGGRVRRPAATIKYTRGNKSNG